MRDKFFDHNIYPKKILDHMKHLVVKSILTKSEYKNKYYDNIRKKNSIIYPKIQGYAKRDYQIMNPVLSKEYADNISNALKAEVKDHKEFIKNYPEYNSNYEEIINGIIHEKTKLKDIEEMIGELFKYDNYSEQRFLLRGDQIGTTSKKIELFQKLYRNFKFGDMKNCIYTHKAFLSTSSSVPFDRSLLITIITDPIFQDHFAKNIKASTSFTYEDEVLFLPDSKFMVVYFEKRNPISSHMIKALINNETTLKYKYFLVLLALPLYYDENNYREAPFIRDSFNYWKEVANS
ncbi:hypothetical protein [Fluviispira sanaruensis]|uniref:hypothetical protein n=1 Tax=Fluviispira sanaruensis TaxID=2493639 RepID=UPI00102E853D|nr:hypothetical protein [Fluviispira sanaruensis]